MRFYGARFAIEAMFKDCKTGDYNFEKTKVSEPRFLALVLLIAIAYSLTIMRGQQLNIAPRRSYYLSSPRIPSLCRTTQLELLSERCVKMDTNYKSLLKIVLSCGMLPLAHLREMALGCQSFGLIK